MEELRIIALVQARMTSQRLPHKVLLPLANTTAVDLIHRRLSRSSLVDEIYFAIPDTYNANAILSHYLSRRYQVFCGDEQNVLSRMLSAARYVEADAIVRVTADCPLVCPSVLDEVISLFLDLKLDYASNVAVPSFPDGFDVEVISVRALEKAAEDAKSDHHLEHVTTFIRDNHRFSQRNLIRTGYSESDQRVFVTLDYIQDYFLIDELLVKFQGSDEFTCTEVIDAISTDKNLINLHNQVLKIRNLL